jgi:hypothetical protein
MDLLNATAMQAGYTMAVQPDGRELLVVAVKGTFLIPDHPEKEPELAEEQVPLVHTDVFTGEPGFSAPLYEIDYAPRKPRCDVLLNGSAYAPRGKPVERVTVSLRVGAMTKSFEVVGKRVWKRGVMLVTSTDPEPFTVMPFSYDNAFGGVDRSQKDQDKHRWYSTNHAGVGYHEYLDPEFVDGKSLPNTEETGRRVTDPRGKYRPMAFGPVGRAWQPRPKLAGTYDQKWIDERFPFLPADFDERYFQAAADDQQIDHPRGGEQVELVNLTPEGQTEFKLPKMSVPFEFFYKNSDRKRMAGVVDTIVLEPDHGRFQISRRVCLPLRRNLHEIRLAVVGRLPDEWYWEQGLERRKRRFKSLADLAAWNRTRGKRK